MSLPSDFPENSLPLYPHDAKLGGNDMIIAVMGLTGSGKSSFINLLSGSNLTTSHRLVSCTQDVQAGSEFQLDGRWVTLIDTPGFDDTDLSEVEILKLISGFLAEHYSRGAILHGLLFFHRISDIRVGSVSRRSFSLFRNLCGDAMRNVAFVTTMWDKVTLAEGEAREIELGNDPRFFRPTLDQGAFMIRHDNTIESARDIIRRIFSNHPIPLDIQIDLVEKKRTLFTTNVGRVFADEVDQSAEWFVKKIKKVTQYMDETIRQRDEALAPPSCSSPRNCGNNMLPNLDRLTILGRSISTFSRASDLPEPVWQALRSNPRNANVILPSALKILAAEKSTGFHQNNVWIIYTSQNPPFPIEFILSCTEGYMGSYPIFIMTTLPYDQLTDAYIQPCVQMLAEALNNAVHVQRVYSVFAPEPITRLFVEAWTGLTGIESYEEPYYAANITYCPKRSFVSRQTSIHPVNTYEIRPAEPGDINEIADLCFEFAEDAFPFQLTQASALQEATYLVQHGLVWVHRILTPGQNQSEIASAVAFTRNSETVAAISKVITSARWRGLGCAERLVRRVCKHLILTKESVVVYVAHDNPDAAKVYRRAGFVGLEGKTVEGVDPWVETGFDRSEVRLRW